MLLTKAWENYEVDKRIEGYSPHTIKAYKVQLYLLIKYFKDIDITTLTTEDLKQYLISNGDHLKPASLAHRIRFIKSLLRWAYEEGYLNHNPAAKIKEPKLGQRIPKFLSEQEIELLREVCYSPMENALFEFMFSTGCRIGELAMLNKEHIDWSSRSAIVRGKGDKEREVYFNTRSDIWLKRYLDDRQDQDSALFVTERCPHRMSTAQIRYIIKRISKRAAFNKNIHPHQFRHSYATHLLNNGAPLEVIQTLLGHEKSETTRVYAHLIGKIRKDFF
ncbi:tyrosine-type recombinase/integrase [Peribacillus deserti]|uniref:Integrase n=1 Tax=Peribacillus deserti TaxID=673318 RepID=A0A2N5M3Z8_9BACI|nr:tyrosine-type recombinase/integrase [Peribacillus deserti]PLT29089.1 integrase [Peribacillus deserti]